MPHTFIGVLEGSERSDVEKAHDHSIEECRTLQACIERLIQEGHLSCYVLGRNERDCTNLKTKGREVEDEQHRSGWEVARREKG
ncbi:hypothetical protein CR513_48694, partial [Mucuna pruriens]